MKKPLAIKVEALGKCYRLYNHPLKRVMDLVMPGLAKRYQPFWALKNASFEIHSGQTVGIIGRNGSGKSTLLEMICDTLQPTEGNITVNGRIAALLELGAGFNPEFTGSENVYMNGAIMGIDRAVIEQKFDEIAQFANIGEHIHHPVKTYSSGMFVRLAFATSIHLDPDILIVDEALAVGDIRFQRKCFRAFEDFKRRGKTILFVTHAVELVRTHCDHAILLDKGHITCQGEPREVVHEYLDNMFGANSTNDSKSMGGVDKNQQDNAKLPVNTVDDVASQRRSYNASEFRWGTGSASIVDYLVLIGDDEDPVMIEQGVSFRIEMLVKFYSSLEDLIYGITIKTLDGVSVYVANTRARKIVVKPRKEGELARICFTLQNHLLPGDYFVSLGVAQDDDSVDNLAIDRRYDLFTLIVDGDKQDVGLADLGMQLKESTEVL